MADGDISSNGSVPLDVVRQVVREEIASLALGVKILLEDVAELRKDMRDVKARVGALERS